MNDAEQNQVELNVLVSLGFIQVSVTIMQEILWSEKYEFSVGPLFLKYEFSVGPLFLRDCMLEQASLIDSWFFDLCELGPGLVRMSPAKSNKIRKAVLFFTAIYLPMLRVYGNYNLFKFFYRGDRL